MLIAERQDRVSGSTALSSGLIPAADTNAQRRQQLEDDTDQFFSDIMAKNNHQADQAHVWRCVNGVRAAINWLETDHDIPFHVLDSFLYQAIATIECMLSLKSQARIWSDGWNAASNQEIPISCNLKITNLVVSDTGKLIGAQENAQMVAKRRLRLKRLFWPVMAMVAIVIWSQNIFQKCAMLSILAMPEIKARQCFGGRRWGLK